MTRRGSVRDPIAACVDDDGALVRRARAAETGKAKQDHSGDQASRQHIHGDLLSSSATAHAAAGKGPHYRRIPRCAL